MLSNEIQDARIESFYQAQESSRGTNLRAEDVTASLETKSKEPPGQEGASDS
jgi:hypothetical protein